MKLPTAFRYVEATTDAWAAKHGITHISVLSVDTEGWDALVLEGADGMLSRRQIDALEFEYHSVGLWSPSAPETDRRTLKAAVTRLWQHGYTCFFVGKASPAVIAVNGPHWCDHYEIHQASNIVCAHAPETVARMFNLAHTPCTGSREACEGRLYLEEQK